MERGYKYLRRIAGNSTLPNDIILSRHSGKDPKYVLSRSASSDPVSNRKDNRGSIAKLTQICYIFCQPSI